MDRFQTFFEAIKVDSGSSSDLIIEVDVFPLELFDKLVKVDTEDQCALVEGSFISPQLGEALALDRFEEGHDFMDFPLLEEGLLQNKREVFHLQVSDGRLAGHTVGNHKRRIFERVHHLALLQVELLITVLNKSDQRSKHGFNCLQPHVQDL